MKNRLFIMFIIALLGLNLFKACGSISLRDEAHVPGAGSTSLRDEAHVSDAEDENDEISGLDKNQGELRFDGLYCFIIDEDGDGYMDNYVFRFYPDGTVIYAGISQTEQSGRYFPRASWFDKDHEPLSVAIGTYDLSDGISFTAYTESGSLEFSGELYDGFMVLDEHSNINGYENFDRKYEFYPFNKIEGWNE